MSTDYNGQSSKDDELSIMFSENMDWQSMPTHAEEVVIYPVTGTHVKGSSHIKVKNLVDSAWEKTFLWGNLVANHYKGDYSAYGLTVPGKSGGMIRVLRKGSSDRIILKGFHGPVKDLSFAFHEKRILLAAVDEFGYLFVHEIQGPTYELILQVNPDGITTASDAQRVVWCPYVPEAPSDYDDTTGDVRNDAKDHALLLAVAHNSRVEVWHLGLINGNVTYASVNTGATEVSAFEDAVVDIAFSPDSTAIAVASLDGYVKFFLVNTVKQPPKMLHKWQPHDGKKLSGISFLDNLNHPNIRDCPLWKWAVTSAEHNTEFKLWSCEQWKCHQTIRFKSTESTPIRQKMALDMSASFLLVTDMDRKVLYVMHIEQEPCQPSLKSDNCLPVEVVSKVSSITQLILSFSPISLAICDVSRKPKSKVDTDFEAEEKCNRVSLKTLVVHPKSVQKCKVVFELGTSVTLGEALDPSYSTINTTTEYESTSTKTSSSNFFNLLTPDSFVSPAKPNGNADHSSTLTTPSSVPLPPVTPNEMLALSSPRRNAPDASTTTPRDKTNGGAHSSGSSPSREVEEILGTIDSSDPSSANVPSMPGGVLQDAVSAYPPSLSPAFRAASACSKEAPSPSPSKDKFNTQPVEDPLCIYPAASVTAAASSVPSDLNGSLLELFKEALVNPTEPNLPPMPVAQTWPTVLPTHSVQPQQQRPHREQQAEAEALGSSAQLSAMQQTLNQLVSLASAQMAEQQQLKNEVARLRLELDRSDRATGPAGQSNWLPQLESTFALHFDKQSKKLDEINAPAKLQQTVNKLQSAIRSEFENKAHTFEQRSVDFIRKELQSVIAGEMAKMEPILKSSSMQLLSNIAQNKALVDAYSTAATTAAVGAMNRACKDTMGQHLLPALERSFGQLFSQLHDTFAKGIAEFVRNIESHLERHRRLQDKESAAQLGATMEKMRLALEQARESIASDTKAELRKMSTELPDRVRGQLISTIQGEMQNIAKSQKVALDGALLAVQQVAQVQSRSATPSVAPASPMVLQNQLKHLVESGRWTEAFQKALSVSDLNMVLFVCRLVDAQQLFGSSPCVLPQNVLLALIQQLSADLGMSTDLKADYLQEAILALDYTDSITKEHGSKVIDLLVRQLQDQLAHQPIGPLNRRLRMLLLTAQSLSK